jgi:sugar diacid utilization regulator
VRELQARMLAAVLEGEGLEGVAELAAAEAGGPVAIELPARGLAAAAPQDARSRELADYVAAQVDGSKALRPDDVDIELPVLAGSEQIGAVVALTPNGGGVAPGLKVDRQEVLRSAAVAALAQVAATDARDALAEDLRGSLLEDLRGGRIEPEEAVRRATKMGCDLSNGAVVLVADVQSAKPRMSAALIASEWQGAIAEPSEADRVYALLPARDVEDPAGDTVRGARTISARLASHGPSGFSSFCADPADLPRAISEAELVLDIISRDERLGEQLAGGIGGGVYRLLLRALASNPDEVVRFYEDTVAPLVTHDREYRTDLLGTVEAYLANDCNMNATARAVFAHRHTVAHRLERARELTGLDPSTGEDRERLGLGIKAYRLLAPTLHR